MELEDVLAGNQAWWTLLGMLLYAVPLGALRVLSPGPAPPHVRALDGLSMLALGVALPWACRQLGVPQALAGVGLALPILLGLRYHLKRAADRRYSARQVPLLLLFRGSFLPKALRAAHLSEARVCQQLAKQGVYRVSSLFVVVYEPEGTLSWTYFSPSVPDAAHLADVMRLNPN